MHVARALWPSSNGRTYESIYLRESFRQDGKVKKRDIANLTHCDPAEIAAIELALKHKGDLAALASLDGVQLQEGASVGAVWTAAEIARRLGLDHALGTDFSGQLALWQVIARLLDQGSRLSAVRLAQVHAACDVLGIGRGFDENDLYENLTWLCQHQEQIELRLFAARRVQRKPESATAPSGSGTELRRSCIVAKSSIFGMPWNTPGPLPACVTEKIPHKPTAGCIKLPKTCGPARCKT
jgi:hypothetical protein